MGGRPEVAEDEGPLPCCFPRQKHTFPGPAFPFLLGRGEGVGKILREGLTRHFPASWERPPVSAVSLSPPQQPSGAPRTLAGQWSS